MRSIALGLGLALMLALGGCGITNQLSSVSGYEDLDDSLSESERARKDLFDAAAAYVLIQEVLKQAVLNPDVGSEFKDAIRQADREVTLAMGAYRGALDTAPDTLTAQLQLVLVAIQRANLLLVQYMATAAQSIIVPIDDGSAWLGKAHVAAGAGDRKGYSKAMRGYAEWAKRAAAQGGGS